MRRTRPGNRSAIRNLAGGLVAACVGLAIAACGSGSSPSTLDPAAAVAASVPGFITLTVPEGDQLDRLRDVVEDFGGQRAWNELSSAFTRSLARRKLSWRNDIAPWIGERIGLALTSVTGLSGAAGDRGIVLVLPTDDMKAAVAFARKTNARASGRTYATDGHYLLIGDSAAVHRLKAARGARLSSAVGYSTVHRTVGSDDAMVYLAVKPLLSWLLSRAATSESGLARTASGGEIATLERQAARLRADATVGLGLAVSDHAVSVDVASHDIDPSIAGPHGAPSVTVAGLPAGSIAALALDLAVPGDEAALNQLTATLSRAASPGAARGSGTTHAVPLTRAGAKASSILAEVLPALGPLQFAFGGTSLLGIHGGLSLSPANPRAAASLITALFDELENGGTVDVSGSARDFVIGVGPFKIHVSDESGKVLALLGYTSAGQLLHPAATLASDSTYQSAVSALPAHAKVPLYVSFTALDKLLSAFSEGKIHQADQVLGKLSYLVLGTAPGDTRLVLGLN